MSDEPLRKLSSSDDEFKTIVQSGRYLMVSLDGNDLKRCVAYDIDAGTVECVVEDANGDVTVVDGEVLTQTLKGVVTVRWFQP